MRLICKQLAGLWPQKLTLNCNAVLYVGPRGKPMVTFLDSASVALFGMVRIIMVFAPIAALCAMAS